MIKKCIREANCCKRLNPADKQAKENKNIKK
jgi:hypothetical protein